MKKIFLNILTLVFSLFFISINQLGHASALESEQRHSPTNGNNCISLDGDISKLEKEYSINTHLLATRKQEIENLPAEASSKKMKLTSETFIIAAKIETAQNWINIKRHEKINQKCVTK